MIALVTAAWVFNEKLFTGGGQKLVKTTIPKVAEKEPMLFLPAIKEIGLADDLAELREKLEKYNIIIPEKIVNNNPNYSMSYDEMLKIYKDEIIRNDVRLIFDPFPTIDINFSNKLNKLKLIKNGILPYVNICNSVLSFDAYCLSKITGRKLAVIYQNFARNQEATLKYYFYGRKYRFRDPSDLLKLRYQYIISTKIRNILKNGKILVVSEGTLKEIPLNKNVYDVKVLEYALPLKEDIIKYRSKEKEDYIIFLARLIETKGVTELPLIMKYIALLIKYDVKLYIIGKFFDKEYENYIKNLIKKFNLENNIKFLGFLKDEDKYKIVSKARLLIYPTHDDLYSYVILESIAVGTPVVSYAIPGPFSVFKDLPAVRFVKEFDIKGMAEEAVRILKMKDEDYYDLVYNEKVNEFIDKRRGWNKVAEEIYSSMIN